MSFFNEYPYTDFHELNLDWIIKIVKSMQTTLDSFVNSYRTIYPVKLAAEMEDKNRLYLYIGNEAGMLHNYWYYFDKDTGAWTPGALYGSANIDQAFDDVSVNALENRVITKYLKNKDIYITPEEYGAKGDGVTDDTEALQAAVNAAATSRKALILSQKYCITNTITVPSHVNLRGLFMNEIEPAVYVGDNVLTAFHCTGVENSFEQFVIASQNGYSPYDAIVMDGNDRHDIDSYVKGMTISSCETGVVVKGRNVSFDGCLFSHCQYGIHFDIDGLSGMRGLDVHNCRFHGIGEEADLVYTNCAGVLCENNEESDLKITDCIADRGAGLFAGSASNLLFSNNMIFCWETPAIKIAYDTATLPSGHGFLHIHDNTMRGIQGTDTADRVCTFPDNMIEITNVNSGITIENNTISNVHEYFVSAKTSIVFIQNNSLWFVEEGLCYIDDSTVYAINNKNMRTAHVIKLASGEAGATNTLIANGNIAFSSYDNITVNASEVALFSGTFGTQLLDDLNLLPSQFLIRLSDAKTAWYCQRQGYYFSVTPWISSSKMYVPEFRRSGTTVTVYLHVLTLSTGVWSYETPNFSIRTVL